MGDEDGGTLSLLLYFAFWFLGNNFCERTPPTHCASVRRDALLTSDRCILPQRLQSASQHVRGDVGDALNLAAQLRSLSPISLLSLWQTISKTRRPSMPLAASKQDLV